MSSNKKPIDSLTPYQKKTRPQQPNLTLHDFIIRKIRAIVDYHSSYQVLDATIDASRVDFWKILPRLFASLAKRSFKNTTIRIKKYRALTIKHIFTYICTLDKKWVPCRMSGMCRCQVLFFPNTNAAKIWNLFMPQLTRAPV